MCRIANCRRVTSSSLGLTGVTIVAGLAHARVLLSIAAVVAVGVTQGDAPRDPPPSAISRTEWTARIHAGWVGKVSAGSGAIPTELWHKDMIRAKYGYLHAPPQTPTSRGPLDDTTLAFLGWHTAAERGAGFTSADVARSWVDHLTDADLVGGGYGSEFLSGLSRLRAGEQPPIRTGSPRAEWIAAQMRAEIWGMLAPGDPARAAEFARRDAEILNVGNAVCAAQFVASLASVLMVSDDIPGAIAEARASIAADSALARLIDDTVRWHAEAPGDWESAWQAFADSYRDRSFEERLEAWSPEWLVETGGWPEADILTEYVGQRNVLRTHPFSEAEPAVLTTQVGIPASGGTLRLLVNANERPADVDWLLRVRVDGAVVHESTIGWRNGAPEWQALTIDLAPWAGGSPTIVVENAVAGRFAWEAAFLTAPELVNAEGHPLAGVRPGGRAPRYPLEFSPRILPETFAVLAGLLYGGGDFRTSVSVATMAGFDTDCNAGTVGCLLGLRGGLAAIPDDWKAPLADRYELQVTGLPREWAIADLAEAIVATGEALAPHATPPIQRSTIGPPRPSLTAPRTARLTLMALGDANSVEDLARLPRRYDLMIASHSVGQEVLAAFRERNPDARVLCYFNTSDVNADWAGDSYYGRLWNDTNPHEDWFHHDAAGERVRIYYPKYPNRHAFNTGNPELRRYLAERVVETLQTGLYDGVQLDNVSTEFPFPERLVGKWISAPPAGLTPEQWTADEVAMLSEIMRAVAAAGLEEKTIIFNHMRSGEPEESRAYVETTDGANCESWLLRRTELEGRWGWLAKVDQVTEVNGAGKLTNLLCVSPQPTEEEALFCFASYLMAMDGDQAYFFYGPNYRIATQEQVAYPWLDVDLGEPDGERAPLGGGFVRAFTKGLAAVNPTTASVTLDLPGEFATLAGERVMRVSLAPKTGALLLRPDRDEGR